MEIFENTIPFLNYQTYYRTVGKRGSKPPVVLLHGGPGSSHNYFEVLDELAEKDNRQIIMYDQLGCGNSSIPDDHPEIYTQETWVKELENLRQRLHLNQIHLLGQSWGGMLAIIYMCDYHPKGIQSLILSSTLSSASLWSKELHRLIKYLPIEEQAAIHRAELTHNFSDGAYLKANEHFMDQHVFKITNESPEPVRRKKIGGTVAYNIAWGPNEYTPEGNLHDYEYTKALAKITTPTLITSGTDDLCTPLVAKTMNDNLPNSQWELFENCGHMPFVQKTNEYVDLLINWLNSRD
ncbi:proline iminopeptidase [Lactobacillus intestinalis]|uniref:Proline iminopeptidase n=1 Tax=Lactobacillus intestinalis DSM 6629 TaxID=1423761 RepID=A0ABR5PT21_9LACO|nr:proline iminopeptidase-family hydrolase [Lactobacillus intestinalis]KRM34194.1 prolyl aminopeptidase [Lactobacillus intestinalis DSM 6629]UTW40394.1 proline iminopeptidase-family hydrolase [Lactobacillus intestinalis]